jgi:hypothetical protein
MALQSVTAWSVEGPPVPVDVSLPKISDSRCLFYTNGAVLRHGMTSRQ